MIPFNYHHLYYFYVIAHEGSIAKATKVLHLAQPTLSAQLKQFERFLKTDLFIRENKRLILTDEGRQVLSYAKTIFDIGQEMRSRVVDLTPEGRIRIHIGITNFVPKTVVDVLLDYLLKIEPSVYIHLKKDSMDSLISQLNDHHLDFILTDTPFETTLPGSIDNKFIGKIPIAFCAHPKLAKKIKKFPQDLNNQPMLLPAAPRQVSYALKEYFYENNINPRYVGEIEDLETVRRLALRGYGIAPINILTIQGAPSQQKLCILNTHAQCRIYESIYIITKKRKMPHRLVTAVLHSFLLEDYLILPKRRSSHL